MSSEPSFLRRWWERFDRSHQRLGYALEVFERDLAHSVADLDPKPRWHERAELLLATAKQAFTKRDTEKGWICLKAARRSALHRLAGVELELEAKVVLAEATAADKMISKWRRQAIEGLLAEQPTAALSVWRVARARALMDEYQDNVYEKLEILRARFHWLVPLSAVALVLWVLYPPFTPSFVESFSLASGPDMSVRGSRQFWLAIVMTGALGALASAFVSSIRGQGAIPEELANSTIHFARLATGMVSAVAVCLFIASDLIKGLVPSYPMVLAAAFAAGFSDRLLLRALEATSRSA